MPTDIRVAVVDDHPLLRAGVVQTLAAAPGLEVVAQGESAEDALEIAKEFAPDVLFLDINMVGSGIDAAKSICREHTQIRIMMLTVVADEDVVMSALRAGVAGYVLKGVSGAELIESVRRVHRGERYVFPSLAAKLLCSDRSTLQAAAAPRVGLSPREEQILSCLGEGLSNKEIGRSLQLSEKTIKHYLSGLLSKLQVRNRVEAAILASSYASPLAGGGAVLHSPQHAPDR